MIVTMFLQILQYVSYFFLFQARRDRLVQQSHRTENYQVRGHHPKVVATCNLTHNYVSCNKQQRCTTNDVNVYPLLEARSDSKYDTLPNDNLSGQRS